MKADHDVLSKLKVILHGVLELKHFFKERAYRDPSKLKNNHLTLLMDVYFVVKFYPWSQF